MDWLTLLVLAHLLMLPFCLKGMLKKRKELNETSTQGSNSSSDLQHIQIKMEKLMEQNRQLQQEMMSLKNGNSKTESSSNVYRIK